MWRDIAYSIGHILKRSVTNDPDFAKSVKMKKSKGSHIELQGPAEKSKMLIETLRSVPMQLVLMSHTEVWPLEQLTVYTLVRAQSFSAWVFQLHRLWRVAQACSCQNVKWQFDRIIFGHMSELTAGNNLSCLHTAQFISREAFHYLFGCTHFCWG